jgi:hypothetical protein
VLIVDVVARLAVALEHALNGNIAVLRPLPADAPETVIEHKFNAGAVGRRPLRGAVEDDILHGFAAQVARLRFAQHPAHRVDDIRFAAAVRADHAEQLARHGQMRGIGEGLEARNLYVT